MLIEAHIDIIESSMTSPFTLSSQQAPPTKHSVGSNICNNQSCIEYIYSI